MRHFVWTASGLKISIDHVGRSRNRVIVIAPGFFAYKDIPIFRKLAVDLDSTFDVISMDFRGHGESAGVYTFSALEKEDLKAVLDYAKTHYKKVGVIGFSYGAAIAMIEQAQTRNIDSLVCVSSPMASEKIEFKWWTLGAIKLGLRSLRLRTGVRLGNPLLPKTRPIDIVASLGVPVFFLHGDCDPIVGIIHSRMLYEKAKEPKKIMIFKKASHADEIYRAFPALFTKEVKAWFNDTLGE